MAFIGEVTLVPSGAGQSRTAPGPQGPGALSGKEETTPVWLRAGGIVRLTTPVRASTHTVPPPHHRPPSPRGPHSGAGGGPEKDQCE
ncbi:unnamed protein product [Arctogadus glacialis]